MCIYYINLRPRLHCSGQFFYLCKPFTRNRASSVTEALFTRVHNAFLSTAFISTWFRCLHESALKWNGTVPAKSFNLLSIR